MNDDAETGLAAKMAFLSRPSSYPDAPEAIESIETHFAHVFLSRRFAYKVKKPFRYRQIDFTRLEGRRFSCEQEVVLNSRLAAPTYIGVVPLTRSPAGLALEGDGPPVEWLVKMHRLPKERALNVVAARGGVEDIDVHAVVGKLVAFYDRSPRAPWPAAEYVRRLEARCVHDTRELEHASAGLDTALVARARAVPLRFLRDHADLVAARAAAGRVVDAHGDLRPEHVFLTGDPQIIDCLEFSEALRWLDAAEEIAFLALELERIGAADVGRRIFAAYAAAARDPAPPALLDFYRGMRALVRAELAAWRVLDAPAGSDCSHWMARAAWYLEKGSEPFFAHVRG